MLNAEHVGKVLLYMYDTVKVEKIGNTSNGKEWYFINSSYPEEANGYYDLWEQEKMDQILSKQEYYKEIQERSRLKEIAEAEEQARQEKIKAEKENLYGFTDNMTAMQKGKILKCLMKELGFEGKWITRKEFCIILLKRNYYTDTKEYSNMYNKKAKNDYTLSRGLYHPTDRTFYEVTKTEQDFFNYLKDNKIFEAEQIA